MNIKIKHYLSWQRLLASAGLSLLIITSLQHPLGAQAVSEGYSADQVLQRGIIVRLKKGDATKVEPVGSDAADQIHGVVVSANDSPVTLSADGQRVFVATSGHYDVLVSSQNGGINSGDYVAVSALAGIGMKAGTKEPYVIGRALATFDGNKDVISNTQVKDSAGTVKQVNIGRVQVDIGVAKNPLLKATEPNVPEFLRKAAENVAGKAVSPTRIYVSLIIFCASTIVAGILLYGGVRSGIISIGRNPLGRKSIIRSMLQVIVTGIIVFITGIFGVYLILRL